jgi:RHS repeat-associated protein
VGYGNGTAVVYGISGDGSRRGWKEIPYYSGTLGDYDTTTLTPARADSYAFATNGALASGTGWQHEVDDLGRVTALKTSSIEYQRRYSWDAAGRLREAWVPPAGTAKYTYDPDGLRQERDLSGIDIPETGTSNYLWGDGGLSQMKVAGGAPIALYGVGEASYANGDRVLKDGIGSPVARVATGAVAGRWRYDAWGNYRAIADHQGPGTWADATGFTGHQWDGAPQLLYAQQRWYDPETGRFLSRDPVPGSVESPQTLNPYVYAAANPTRYTDPTGAFLPVLPWLAQVAVAGIASFAAGMSWNLVYQEVTGPRGWDYGSLDYGRAAKFGAATAGIGVSGAAFGAATAVSGFGIGGAFNLGGQTLVDGRSLSQVDWGSVYLEGGAGAAVGGAFRWGATSARAGVQFATGFAGMTMSSLGVVNGVQNIGRGVDALAWGETGRGLGLMVFGGAEAGLGWLGARESFEVYERSGLEFYSKGAGSNFANLGVRARGAARMQERAAELNIARDEWMAERGTTAAARVRNRVTGKTETWIATESDGPMPVEWEGKLSRNERFVEGPGHAEETLRSALGEEWELLYGGASRNVCSGRCAPLLRDEGLTIGGPRFRGKADKTRYRMFWKPR